ncbi:MAG: Ig-like domain-containing protein [Vicinamibacterales bacterium]
MTRGGWSSLALLALLVCPSPAAAQPPAPLRVVGTAPNGTLATLEEGNEIRIGFSEPMVTLGRVPTVVEAPFVRITPAMPGRFRWSGTTLLIFTPDPGTRLPYATTYTVTVDTSARSAGGRTLAAPATFTFTTPPVRLQDVRWYRRGDTVAGALVILLRFNQPVRPADIAQHLSAATVRHEWEAPAFTAAERARYEAQDPAGLAAFQAKVEAVTRVAAGGTPVRLRLTTNWDKTQYPEKPEQVVFETTSAVEPESHVRLALGARVPSPAGRATPGRTQAYVIEAEPAFFVHGFRCSAECSADAYNPLRLRAEVPVRAFAAALTATDITTATPQTVRRTAAARRDGDADDRSAFLTLEDAGFAAQPPNRKYVFGLPATLTAADGQTLGYPWLGIVDNWHATAFTSFGDGHGVWERDGGTQLPFYARNVRDILQWAFRIEPAQLMGTIQQLSPGFRSPPPVAGTPRQLRFTADRVQSQGLPLGPALSPGGTGLVWAAVQDGRILDRTRRSSDNRSPRASIVQVTNLGVTVKDSPHNTLVFVTRLDTGAPVAGAAVSS